MGELGRHLALLERDRDALRKAVDEASARYEAASGSTFQSVYSAHIDSTHRTYKYACSKHRDAMAILSDPDTFSYHPAYKRQGDQFTGVHYTPAQLRKAEEKNT